MLLNCRNQTLDDEVEIIEEDKEIEHLLISPDTSFKDIKKITRKINEIIDKVQLRLQDLKGNKLDKAVFNIADVKGLLDSYNEEVKISHYLQSELDMANAKLIEQKEKNRILQNRNDRQRFLIRELDKNHIIPDIDNKILDYISKDKIRELRDIDNIDLLQAKLKELLEE